MTTPERLIDRFRRAVASPLPLPGRGATAARFDVFRSLARGDMTLARLVEAHEDARAIAADLGTDLVDPGATYGVWAAAGPAPLTVIGPAVSTQLVGVQPWCGGATIVDRALVIAPFEGRPRLFDVAADGLQRVVDEAEWTSDAFASLGTIAVRFDDTPATLLTPAAGSDVNYLDRAGFWHGAVGVAAVWAGGLAGIVDAHRAVWRRRDPHSLAHLGAADAELAAIDAIIAQAARDIDERPSDRRAAERRARRVRYAVDRAATRAIDHLQIGSGPWPLAHAPEVVQRTNELTMALRQCHGERDLEPLGADLLSSDRHPRDIS